MEDIANERGEYRNPVVHGAVFLVVSGGMWFLGYAASGWPTAFRIVAALVMFVFSMGILGLTLDELRRRA